MSAMTDSTQPEAPAPVAEPSIPPPPPAAITPKPRRRQGILVAAVAVGLVIVIGLVAVVLIGQRGSSDMTVKGVMTVAADATTTLDALNAGQAAAGDACVLPDGYQDLSGAQVAITDDVGHTLGLGQLGDPVFTIAVKSGDPGICSLPFTISGVSKAKTVYTITIGRRGSVKFTRKQMEDGPVLDIQ